MEAKNRPREKKKVVNIAQKMLKSQAETSLFLMRKTTHREREREREREGGNEKDEKKDRKKERSRSQKVKIR